MESINIHPAKTHLSRLVERAAAGETIIIAKAGKPMAKLVPLQAVLGPREPGYWRGQVRMAEDFDTLPGDIAAAFRGEGE
jgi:prevent-host-death family protein